MRVLHARGLAIIGGALLLGAVGSIHLLAEEPAKFDPQPFIQSARDLEGKFDYDWKEVVSLTFEDPKELSKYSILAGQWAIDNGSLIATEGEKSRAILLAPSGLDPVRIEFDATLQAAPNGQIGDITILLNATPEKYFTSGYTLTTGSYWNHCSTFYRLGRPIANTEYSPLTPQKTNHIVVESHQGHLRYWLNGQILLEAWDSQPIAMDAKSWIGLRTYGTTMSIDNLKISSADVAPKPRKRQK